MYTKAKKTISHVTPEIPISLEERKQRIMQILAQKREQFAVTILSGMVQGAVTNKDVTNIQCKCLVDLAVEMADALMEQLYPMPKEEKPKEATTAEKKRERLKGNLKEEVCASDVCAYRGKNVCTIKRDEYCPMFRHKEDKE